MRGIRQGILLAAVLTAMGSAEAQTTGEAVPSLPWGLQTLYAETRMAAERQWYGGAADHDASGFRGQYLNLRIDGRLSTGLTFSYRQRFNKLTDRTFFDATDWLHLDWQATGHLRLGAGKQVVAIGGYEYDRAPIDLYYCSEFWGNIACYQLGVSATLIASDHDQWLLQCCNSPFRLTAGNDTYAWNLLWQGSHGCLETLWSANLLEYEQGHWISYVALGNKLHFGQRCHLELDLMNRAAAHQAWLGRDVSVMAELSCQPTPAMRCYGKYTYDVNRSGTASDLLVLDGTELHGASLGIEWRAWEGRGCTEVRLFGATAYSWGTNANPTPYLPACRLQAQLGFRLRVGCQSHP